MKKIRDKDIKVTAKNKYTYKLYLKNQKRQVRVTANTKEELRQKCYELLARNDPSDYPEITVAEAIDIYIEKKKNSKKYSLSPSTIKGYYVIMRNYVPQIMKTKIRNLTKSLLETEFENDEHSTKTLKNAYGLISAACKMAGCEIPKISIRGKTKKKPIYVPDPNEIQDIYKLVKEYKGGLLEKPFVLAAFCGLRASEISGLYKNCVKRNVVLIQQALVYGNGGNVLKSPKTDLSEREVPISETTRNILLKDVDESGRICLLPSYRISQEWIKFRTAYNLDKRMNFHALRHYFASVCMVKGMPLKYIANWMGHSSMEMLNRIYLHTFSSADSSYAARHRKSIEKILTA